MAVERIEILGREDYEHGRAFAEAGAYERIEALVHYALDPLHAANAGIVDLALAPRDDDGQVRFVGDLTLLRPRETDRGNHALLMQVPNRGRRQLARFNLGPFDTTISATIPPGDGFLFRRGWTIAWAGWQWDVPRDAGRERVGLAAPQVPMVARAPASQMQLRLQPNRPLPSLALTDQHVGDLGRHRPVRARRIDDAAARLLVRDGPYGAASEIERGRWRFARDDDGRPVPDDAFVWLDGGFEAGRTYDLLYEPLECPVVGAGLLAMRDAASYLRYAPEAPCAGAIRHVVAEGQSQCGRFLRTLLHLGLNADEAGRPAFDGVLAHIAGGRRGEFNHRYGQPSVQPTPSFGHLYPFADTAHADPFGAAAAGLLDRQRADGGLPRIVYTDTSSEYWRGDAGLSHTDPADGADLELLSEVRRYLFASTQHGPGAAALGDLTMFGNRGGNALNMIDYRPLYRAALANLLAWVAEGVEPPDSALPRADDGSRVSRREALDRLSAVPGLALPEPALMTAIRPLDLGPDAARGIGRMPAVAGREAYPDWVSALDDDGNEIAGIRMPDVDVPVATHTGFNPRHPAIGAAGELLEYIGSSLPFAPDRAARVAADDPRPSLAERYAGREAYLEAVRAAAEGLAAARYLLAEDVEVCVEIAAERYDLCAGLSRTG